MCSPSGVGHASRCRKLALKMAGRPMTDKEAGPVTWDVWMLKK
jgi:hypothetical protein